MVIFGENIGGDAIGDNAQSALFGVIAHYLVQGLHHVLHILLDHGLEQWQGDEGLVSAFGHGVLPATKSEPVPVIRVQVYRDIVDVHLDVILPARP